MGQLLTIVGPNLPRQAGAATFHVHAVGCADLKRGWIRPHAECGWDMEAERRLDVEAEVYDFMPDEDPDYRLGDYQYDFYFAPCVTVPHG